MTDPVKRLLKCINLVWYVSFQNSIIFSSIFLNSKSAEMPIHSPAMGHHVHDAITPLPTSPPSPRHPFSAPTTPCTAISPVPGHSPRRSVGKLPGVGWGQGSPMPSHPTIVHPGAVLSLMDLLPSIDADCDDKVRMQSFWGHGGKTPVSNRYPVNDCLTSTQPYILKVAYHYKTTLRMHTHCE